MVIDLTAQCGDEAALIAAINTANSTPAPDEITLGVACYYAFSAADNTDGTTSNALPVITQPLTITGNGSNITSTDAEVFRFIRTTANLTITDVAFSDGSDLTGGAIYFAGGTSSIAGSSFVVNDADNGGAVYIAAGATVTFSSTTFASNGSLDPSVDGNCGGGAIHSSGTVFILASSEFTDNSSEESGGAICNYGVMSIEDTTFDGNSSADADAGAIANSGTLTIRDSLFENNTSKYHGGAIYSQESLVLETSTFDGNSSEQGDGGALSVREEAEVRDTILTDNSASESGGAIYATTADLTIERVGIVDNVAGDDGGGIFAIGSSLEIEDSLISDNQAASGGGVYSSQGTLIVANSTFTYNDADIAAAIYSSTGVSTVHTFTHLTIASNYSSGAALDIPASAVVKNSIVANSESGSDCDATGATFTGSIDSDGTCGTATTYALAAIDFGPLQDNGGPTHTIAIPTTSVAANFGIAADCTATDQRGVPRPAGPCSAGAFEAIELPVVTLTGVTSNAVYQYSSVPQAICTTTGASIGTVATLSIQPAGDFAANAVCSGATATDGRAVPIVVATYYITYPLPTVSVTGVVANAVYTYPNIPTPGCTTTEAGGGIGSVATLTVLTGPAVTAFAAVCNGATNILGYPSDPVTVPYIVIIPLANVALTGVTDGATYVYATQPTPGCTTTDGGGGITAIATLTKTGSAPGTITVTCAGAKNAAGLETPPVTANYTVVCSRATTYQGLVTAKLGASSQGTRTIRVELTFNPSNCGLTGIVITPINPLTGSPQLATAIAWKMAKLTPLQWRFTNNTISAATAGIFLNGQMRAMDKTSTLTLKLVNDTNALSLKLSGMAPTGIGIARVGFEIDTTGAGLTPLALP